MADGFKNIYGEPVVTPPARCAFPNLAKPDSGRNQYSDDKYKVHLLFDKNETDFSVLSDALEAVAQQAFGCSWKDVQLQPFKDGDEKDDKYKGFQNCLYIVTKSQFMPPCFDANKVNGVLPQIDPKRIYAGCVLRAYVTPCAFKTMGQPGLTFLLNYIQFLEDGVRFGAGSGLDASDVFAEYKSTKAATKPAAAKNTGVLTALGGGKSTVTTAPTTTVNGVDTSEEAESEGTSTPPKRGRPKKNLLSML